MALIFDRFPTRERAEAFVAAVKATYDHDGQVFADMVEAFWHDPFPYDLDGPVVHIDRADDYANEVQIQALVREFGGVFAGT